MYGEMHLSRRELRSCMDLGKALTSELDQNRLFGTILKKLSDLIPADIWSLLLVERERNELVFKVSVDLDIEEFKDVRIGMGQGIAGQVALTQVPMVVDDVKTCKYFNEQIDLMSGKVTKSVMCVPLIFGSQTVGVIEAINPYKTNKKALSLLMFVADYAAIAVENTRRYHYIQSLANKDNLTGLYNTRYLYNKLNELFEVSRVSGEPLGLIFMDLDNFKRVVDAHGHLNGSQAIQEVAHTIRDCLGEPSFAVSYGGDEFVIVLPRHDKKAAIQKAEEIRALMDKTVYLSNRGINARLSASFGVASYPEDATNITRLLSVADKAMFSIKDRGKHAVGTLF
ncbi:MAG TPA: sensor domain-containing diguanylate cyclase [Spirochaetota bacterium]|nr:sensor domain-containing diguanylate cyclase [Spirochaetota bacterium]